MAVWDTELASPSPELAALLAASVPLGLPRRGRALEAGCGAGVESALLARRGWTVLGFDPDREAVAEARARCRSRRLSLVTGDAAAVRRSPAFRRGAFDLALDRLVYDNLFPGTDTSGRRAAGGLRRERHALLRLVADALRPGGLFLMRFHHEGRPPSLEEDAAFAATLFDFDLRDAVPYEALIEPRGAGDRRTIGTIPLSALLLRRAGRE